MKIIVLAGGQGKRLWPLSTQKHPKQFIHFGDHESLLKKTVKRFSALTPVHEIFIVTHREYIEYVITDLYDLDAHFSKRIIVEACSKNTAPAITLAVKRLIDSGCLTESDLIGVVPIDHMVSDDKRFIQQIGEAVESFNTENIQAFGVKCNRADAGYGYIQIGKQLAARKYEVLNFVEKPTLSIATRYFQEGGWYWNIGIYIFPVKTYKKELLRYQPRLYEFLSNPFALENEYAQLNAISVDHAIMIYTDFMQVNILEEISWRDIGSWSSLYEHLKWIGKDPRCLGNVAVETV